MPNSRRKNKTLISFNGQDIRHIHNDYFDMSKVNVDTGKNLKVQTFYPFSPIGSNFVKMSIEDSNVMEKSSFIVWYTILLSFIFFLNCKLIETQYPYKSVRSSHTKLLWVGCNSTLSAVIVHSRIVLK